MHYTFLSLQIFQTTGQSEKKLRKRKTASAWAHTHISMQSIHTQHTQMDRQPENKIPHL